jgi:hypothetical protein
MVLRMRCYVCARMQLTTPAVATCKICSVGLCIEHHVENEERSGPGGMSGYACLHRSSDLSRGHGVATPLQAARALRHSLGRAGAVMGSRNRSGTRAPIPELQEAAQR